MVLIWLGLNILLIYQTIPSTIIDMNGLQTSNLHYFTIKLKF